MAVRTDGEMSKVAQLPEEEFQQWLWEQIQKREFMYGYQLKREEIQQLIYEILFLEQEMQVEEIEKFFIPFGQAGYLSIRRKFELILFVLEKEIHGGAMFFLEEMGCQEMMTAEWIEKLYLEWSLEERLILSQEERKEFFVQTLADQFCFGIVEVLGRIARDGILLGELCPPLFEDEPIDRRAAVCSKGTVIRLPFLGIEEQEELIRIVKSIIAQENKGELTVINPIWECVREDGTCITAVRPPAGKDWGIRILYGAARKERQEWQIQI